MDSKETKGEAAQVTVQTACSGCRFWIRIKPEKDEPKGAGACRRFPPAVVAFIDELGTPQDDDGCRNVYSSAHHFFPKTHESFWCGEFSPNKVI